MYLRNKKLIGVVKLTDKEIGKGTNRRLSKKKFPAEGCEQHRRRDTFRTNKAARRPGRAKPLMFCVFK